MKLLCITDLHGGSAGLGRILADAGPVDLVLLGGDLTNFGSPDDAQAIVRQAQAPGAKVLAVAGNCDSAQIDRRLVELDVSLAGRGLIYRGIALHALSAMPPWRGDMYQFTEEELAEALRAGHADAAGSGHDASGGRHVILSHAPPRNDKLDRTSFFKHVGSTALRTFIDEEQPLLVVCGHIHEGRGIAKLGRTTAVNCGPAAAGYYATAEVADEVKVELRRA